MSIAFWPVIQQITGGPFGSPAAITRDNQWTIVAVDGSVVVGPPINGSFAQYVELPSGCEIGDVVEVYNDGTAIANNPQISPPSGETMHNGASVISGPKSFRKISATIWGSMI